MKWFETTKKTPPFDEWIWIWDLIKDQQSLIKCHEEHWAIYKKGDFFPIWAYLNDEKNENERECQNRCLGTLAQNSLRGDC